MLGEPIFHHIKTLSFDVLNEAVIAPTEVINFQTSALFGISKNSQNEGVQLVIRYSVLFTNRPEEGKDTVVYGQIETETYFIIPGIESFFQENAGYKIPKEIVTPLFEAACSTTRGVAFTRGAGTILDNMPIPLMSAASVFANVQTVDVPILQTEAIEAGLVAA